MLTYEKVAKGLLLVLAERTESERTKYLPRRPALPLRNSGHVIRYMGGHKRFRQKRMAARERVLGAWWHHQVEGKTMSEATGNLDVQGSSVKTLAEVNKLARTTSF